MECKIVFLVQICMILSFGWFSIVEAAAPTFLVPNPDGSTGSRSVSEDAAVDTSILTVEGQDTDGDSLAFSIVTQTPNIPPFELDSLDGLLKVPPGLNAEASRLFTFIFGVNDGAITVNSIPFTVNIVDVNEFTPVFNPTSYTATILDSVSNGYMVTTVTATDKDVTATIIYSIIAVNTPNTFTVAPLTGVLTVTTNTNLNAATTPTYNLTIQASDDTNTANAFVTITVTVDYCATNPCQNGGTCTNSGSSYVCTCVSGYTGTNCTDEVDNCASSPCMNNATCNNLLNMYTCSCMTSYTGTNCQTGGGGEVPGGGSTSTWWIAPIVLGVLGILICIAVILHRHKIINVYKTPFIGELLERCFHRTSNTDPAESTNHPTSYRTDIKSAPPDVKSAPPDDTQSNLRKNSEKLPPIEYAKTSVFQMNIDDHK